VSSPLLDELHWLTEALRAHVDWSRATGSLGLPPCDSVWLEQRRDHYRRTPLQQLDAAEMRETPESPAAPIAPGPSHASSPLRSILSSLDNATAVKPERIHDLEPPAARETPQSQAHETPEVGRSIPAAPDAPPAVLDAEQRQARLVTLQAEVRACTSCGLCEGRTNPAFARGTGSSGIVFVGEGPGAEEDAQGVPFVGAAGQLLDRMIGAMGLSREDVYVCNIIKCRPPNNRKPSDDEVAACRHFAVEQLKLIEPQVIVALGGTAVEGLLGLKLGITRLRGTWRLYEGRIPVMPTFHPAYILRKPEAKREVWQDLQAVLARINRTLPSRT
jgi:uracil-DNA glycosylase